MADVHIKGLAELQKFMDQLPAKVEQNVMRGALRAGMKVILPVAKSNVHSISGWLAAGLKAGARAKAGRVTGYVKATGPHAFLARFIEYGTKAHLISVREEEKNINLRLSARRGKVVRESMTTINRRVLQIGNTFVGPTVNHKGASPKPFMRHALDSQAHNAVEAAAQYMRKRLATKEGMNTRDIEIEVER